ncbi:ethanolamine utilization phosphate acetyltransferase EutD [Enterococcus mediterraneensis]|uniref:ethanolamine utilization phosphate acetyltransferase EutD n=1 Tax=Enterococcus mediterraneensis TaxID=2364791 RepID=UPI000F057D9C|nr:ethanolamine utilization phosphate acetyltransferase EutD [Enterococcus mediterraneensis]
MKSLEQLAEIINEVVKRVREETLSFEVEASGRHIHLSREAIDRLFGEGHQLTKVKDLSQPGQFVCQERITISGPKGLFKNVVILGPERKNSQVEVSLTDARELGIRVPIRESGNIEDTPGIVLMNGDKVLHLDKGLIVAKRHIHMTPEDARKNQVENGQIVKVKINSERALIFDDVVVRVSPKFATYMHIDYDEANACGLNKGDRGAII